MAIGTQTLVRGTRTTSGVNTNMRVRDVEPKVALLEPYQTPIDDFFASNEWANQVTTHPRSQFEWFEDAYLPDVATTTTAIVGGAPTEANIGVSANNFLVKDTILIEATGEVAIVTAVNTATSKIDIRKAGTGNLTAAAIGTRLMRLTPAFEENSAKQTALTVQAVGKSGYCEIIKKGLSMTGRQQAGEYYGGNDWTYQWGKALKEIREALERMYLFNPAAYDETNTDTTISAGFLGTLTTNVITYSGDLDEVEFDDGIKTIFDGGGSNVRDVYVGSGALASLNKFIKARYQLADTINGIGTLKKYGPLSTAVRRPRVLTYLHPQGELRLIWNPQLKGPKYSNSVLVVDPSKVKKRYMAPDKKGPRKYRIETGIETPGDDSYDAQYLFDQGLQIMHEETMGWFHKV